MTQVADKPIEETYVVDIDDLVRFLVMGRDSIYDDWTSIEPNHRGDKKLTLRGEQIFWLAWNREHRHHHLDYRNSEVKRAKRQMMMELYERMPKELGIDPKRDYARRIHAMLVDQFGFSQEVAGDIMREAGPFFAIDAVNWAIAALSEVGGNADVLETFFAGRGGYRKFGIKRQVTVLLAMGIKPPYKEQDEFVGQFARYEAPELVPDDEFEHIMVGAAMAFKRGIPAPIAPALG